MFLKELFALAYDLFNGGWRSFRQRWIHIQLKSYRRASREVEMNERSTAYRSYADRREKTYNRIIKTCLIGCTGIWLCFIPFMFQVTQTSFHEPHQPERIKKIKSPIRPLPPKPKTEPFLWNKHRQSHPF